MTTADVLTITGSISYRERIALPPGAIATVKLVDAEGEVLAGAAHHADGVPSTFDLVVDPELVANPDQLFIWAMLRSEIGVWGTTDLVPITHDDTMVMLTKVDA